MNYTYEIDVVVGIETRHVRGQGRCGDAILSNLLPQVKSKNAINGKCEYEINVMASSMNPVPDEITGKWKERDVEFSECPRRLPPWTTNAPQQRGILLLVESPHKDEFDGCHNPIAPLQSFETRKKLRTHLKSVIEKALEVLTIDQTNLEGSDIVVANPVQFQASLAQFMVLPKVMESLRNNVWRSFFADPAIKEDFRRRIRMYNPALIIVATTSKLRGALLNEIRELNLAGHCAVVSRHPCVWSSSTQSEVRAC